MQTLSPHSKHFDTLQIIDKNEFLVSPGIPQEILPYLKLWVSVLKIALADAAKYEAYAQNERKYVSGEGLKAHRWLFSNSHRETSFIWVCDMLKVDPDAVRRSFKLGWKKLLQKRSTIGEL